MTQLKKTAFISVVLIANFAFAAGKEVTVSVKGMVCSFCAQGITKKFSGESAVEKVKVSLEQKKVNLVLKDGKDLTDDQIETVLKDAGYNVEKIERK